MDKQNKNFVQNILYYLGIPYLIACKLKNNSVKAVRQTAEGIYDFITIFGEACAGMLGGSGKGKRTKRKGGGKRNRIQSKKKYKKIKSKRLGKNNRNRRTRKSRINS